MPVADFMEAALAHPEFGYYRTRDPLGATGDFTTAPEISQVFGELVGACVADVWLRAGSPAPFNLVEAGPGRGTLMADLLRAARNAPGFIDAMRLHLVETSPALRKKQAKALDGYSPDWHERIDTVPDGFTLLVANEFLDALPVEQYVRENGAWRRRGVTCENGAFKPATMTETASFDIDAGDGAIIETSPAVAGFVKSVAERLSRDGGMALFIDYGYEGPAVGDTLQAVRAHKHVSPFDEPGEADITAHVDFTAVKNAAVAVQAYGPVGQGAFLQALGMDVRAEQLMRNADDTQRGEIAGACRRLTAATEMGTLFKALAITGKNTPAPGGF